MACRQAIAEEHCEIITFTMGQFEDMMMSVLDGQLFRMLKYPHDGHTLALYIHPNIGSLKKGLVIFQVIPSSTFSLLTYALEIYLSIMKLQWLELNCMCQL